MPNVLALYLLITATLAAQPTPDVIEAAHQGHATSRRGTTPSLPEAPNA